MALAFDLIGRDVSASRAFRDVGDAADRAGKQGEAFGGRVSSGLKLAAGALLAGGLIQGFESLYEAAAESEKVAKRTANVLQTTGGAANVTARQVSDLATAISRKTGIDDEAIQSGENLLLTFTNVRNEVGRGNDVFNQATSLITDMSVALGQDTSSSAIQLGKALNDPINGVTALTRVGVSFTASQKDQIATLVESGRTLDAQKIILSELGKEFGGAAEAAATPLDKLKVNLGNLAEEVGGFLVPAIDDFATFLSEDVLPGASQVGEVVGNVLGPAFHVAGEALGVVADVGGEVLDFFEGLPGPVQATLGVVGGLVAFKGPLSSFFNGLRDAAETAGLKMLYAKDALAGIGGAGGVAKAGASGFMGLLGGPWGIALTGATVGLSLLVDWLGSTDDATKATEQATQDYADALRSANGVINESVRQQAAKSAQDAGLLDVADQLGISLPTVTSAITNQGEALTSTRDRLQAFIESHTVAEGRSAQFGSTLDAQGQAAQNALNALNNLSGQTLTTAGDEQQLGRATGDVAAGMGGASSAAEQLFADLQDTSDAAGEARQQTDLFKTSLDVLTGQNVSLLEVQASLQDALAAGVDAMGELGGAVLDTGGNLNLTTENGRKASDVLLDVRNSGNELISTMIQQGATTEDVQAADANLRQSFIATAGQMGIGQTEAEKLADKILGIPASRTTTITADTSQARGQLDKLIGDYRGYTINLGLRGGLSSFAAAEGGILPGYTPGRDVHHFLSPTAGALHLSGGEAIMRPEFTAAVGSGWVSSMNKAAKSGGSSGVRKMFGGAFADGGILQEFMAGPLMLSAKIDSAALAATRKELLEPATGLVAALSWAKTQVGKPYGWGAVGPGSYDCSGWISAIINVIRGRNPHTRLGSTASMPWPGLAAGLFGGFQVGSTRNAGGGIGHTAGTLLGVNVESAGGVGVRVGGSARGAHSSLFNEHYSLKYGDGGVIGEPVAGVGMRSGRSYTFGERGPETVTPGMPGGINVKVYIGERELTDIVRVEANGVVVGALTTATDRARYNPW